MNIGRFKGRLIEGVTIDFWHTIAQDRGYVSRKKERAAATQKWLRKEGKQCHIDEVIDAFEDYSRLWMRQWKTHHRTPGPIDAAAYLIVWLGLRPTRTRAKHLADIIENVLIEYPPDPVEGAIDAITELAKHVKLGLVCDTGISGPRIIDELLDKWGILQHFPHRIYSLDIGVSKPEPVMFRTALNKMGVQTHRALHIGDMDETDIIGAKNIGMAAMRFDGDKEKADCKKCSMADLVISDWKEVLNNIEFASFQDTDE